MVTFFCSSCGEYLKKKQAELHRGFCQASLSCNECKGEFKTFQEIKEHTFCPGMTSHQKPSSQNGGHHQSKTSQQSQTTISKEQLKMIGEEWKGFKKTIERLIKEEKEKGISCEELRKRVLYVFKKLEVGYERDFDDVFSVKVSKVKEIQMLGGVYIHEMYSE